MASKTAKTFATQAMSYAVVIWTVALDKDGNAVSSPTVTTMPDFKDRALAAQACRAAMSSVDKTDPVKLKAFVIRTK